MPEDNQGAITGDSPFPENEQPDPSAVGAGDQEKMVSLSQFNSALKEERQSRKLLQSENEVLRLGIANIQQTLTQQNRTFPEKPQTSFTVPEEYSVLHKDYMDPYFANVVKPLIDGMQHQFNQSMGAVADQMDEYRSRLDIPEYANLSKEVETLRKEHYHKTGAVISREMAYHAIKGQKFANGNGETGKGATVVAENMGGETGTVVGPRRGGGPRVKQASEMTQKEREDFLIANGGF